MSRAERIVCLTEETTETLYLMGEERRIVGISGFTVRPPRARREKPRVSAFLTARIDRILALEPDLVLGFSDLQADIAAALVRAGLEVHVFNQRSVAQILDMVRTLGGLIGCEASPWDGTASSPIRSKCRGATPTSCSVRGAARSSRPRRLRDARVGIRCRPCARVNCTRSRAP